jgi:hypothetical protein
MGSVGILAIVLFVCAVLLLIGAEWPRLSERLGGGATRRRRPRRRRRGKGTLRVVEPGDDDFAASVQRDLENLPVIEEQDGKSRR